MLRATKIIATLGPASEKPEVLRDMIRAGVDVVRMNFSHGTVADHKARHDLVRTISAEVGKEVGIMADLQGPKIRVGKFADSKILLKEGEKFTLDVQASLFHRRSEVNYAPDPVGDLTYFGIASQIHHQDEVVGSQIDSSYALNERHTLRAGLFAQQDRMNIDNTSAVFPADVNGNQTSWVPKTVVDNASIKGHLVGAYLQDEWKFSPDFTVNYGVRYDHFFNVKKD